MFDVGLCWEDVFFLPNLIVDVNQIAIRLR